MDFLDPKRRRAHRRRLFIGYILMAIVIAIGTMMALYLAYGYDVDRENGQIIQNGIVFVDSKPKGARVYVNDVAERNETDTRLVLPAGVYTVRLEAEGYRHWERTFNLEGGQIQRLVYPFLIPNSLIITDVEVYDATPQLATQSPDRRWVLVQRPGQTYQLDVFDLNQPDHSPIQVVIPASLLTTPSLEASLEVVEWSNDNRHLLFKRNFAGKTEYIIFDRESPNESVNLNSLLGIKPVEVTLRDKRPDQVYFLDAFPGTLRSADIKARTISAPLLAAVIGYKSYSDDIILYATREGAEAGKTNINILERDKIYLLKTVSESDRYLIDVARYESTWYYVAGSAADDMVFVYKDPLPMIKQETRTPLTVTAILRIENPRFVSFSASTQFVGVQSGKSVLTLDLELERQYRSEIDQDIGLEQQFDWMDGHRYYFVVNQQSYVLDFDGSNLQTLVTSRLSNGPFFDRDYDNVFTIEGSKQDNNKAALTMTVIDN